MRTSKWQDVMPYPKCALSTAQAEVRGFAKAHTKPLRTMGSTGTGWSGGAVCGAGAQQQRAGGKAQQFS